MNRQLATQDPTLPGLLPDVEAARLARSFRTIVEGTVELIDRIPTDLERDVLRRRAEAIADALRPISARASDRPLAAEAIAGLLVGYGYARGDRAAGQTVTVYVKHLESVPLFAIRAACEDVRAGRVFDVDARTGNRRPLNPDKEPSTIRLRTVAQKHVDALAQEKWRFDRVLRAKQTMAPVPTPAERARVGELFRGLQASMKRAAADNDLERQATTTRLEQEATARREREVLAEYGRLGLEPVKIGGVLVSPELARRYDELQPTQSGDRD